MGPRLVFIIIFLSRAILNNWAQKKEKKIVLAYADIIYVYLLKTIPISSNILSMYDE